MATKARGAARDDARPANPTGREPVSLHLLRPQASGTGLSREADEGLGYLQFIAGEDDERFARALLGFSLRRTSQKTAPFVRPPAHAVLNRRKRAARLWVNAVLAGDVSAPTLRAIAQTLVPQLAGTGPDAWRAAAAGRQFVEFLRGVVTASVMKDPMACLIRHAKALHALETVLAVHLGAILSGPRPAPAR